MQMLKKPIQTYSDDQLATMSTLLYDAIMALKSNKDLSLVEQHLEMIMTDIDDEQILRGEILNHHTFKLKGKTIGIR